MYLQHLRQRRWSYKSMEIHLYKENGMKNIVSDIIIDDVLLYGCTPEQLLTDFKTILYVLKQHRTSLNLNKYKWFQDTCKFLGMAVESGRTQPAHSKNEAFTKIEKPYTWGDLCIIIGIFGIYSHFLPLYEIDIRPWRYILPRHPQQRKIYQK